MKLSKIHKFTIFPPQAKVQQISTGEKRNTLTYIDRGRVSRSYRCLERKVKGVRPSRGTPPAGNPPLPGESDTSRGPTEPQCCDRRGRARTAAHPPHFSSVFPEENCVFPTLSGFSASCRFLTVQIM